MLMQVVEHAAGAKKLVLVDEAGHFFEGKLKVMQAAIEAWVRDLYKPPEGATEQT
jgi:alpha/beta superfamily hydrolase